VVLFRIGKLCKIDSISIFISSKLNDEQALEIPIGLFFNDAENPIEHFLAIVGGHFPLAWQQKRTM